MRVELFPFQKKALADIRMKTAEAKLSQDTRAAGGFFHCANRSRKDHHHVCADRGYPVR